MKRCAKCAERSGVTKGILIALGVVAGIAGVATAACLAIRKYRQELAGVVDFTDDDFGWDEGDPDDEIEVEEICEDDKAE